MNSKHWPRIADFGQCGNSVPWDARGLQSKQTLAAPPPPPVSEELQKAQREQEKREAALAAAEDSAKRQREGAAQGAFAGRESARLQGQFRASSQQQAGRSGTGLRL